MDCTNTAAHSKRTPATRRHAKRTALRSELRAPTPQAPALKHSVFRATLIRQRSTEQVELAILPGPPRYLRLPPPGMNCPVTGLSRAYLNLLVLGDKPRVKSYVLRKRSDCETGVRLIDAADLFRYIEEHPAVSPTDAARRSGRRTPREG